MTSVGVLANDGVRLAVEDSGTGPAVILIPGLGGRASFWSNLRQHLADEFRVISVDHRGLGGSEFSQNGATIERLAKDVLDVLDVTSLPSAHVVGHSTGGVIAQRLAVMAPHRIAKLCLSGTWLERDNYFELLFEQRLEMLQHLGPSAYVAQTFLFGYTPQWIVENGAEVRRAVEAAELELPVAATKARLAMLLSDESLSEDGVRSIHIETLVIGAEDDIIIPLHNQARLHALLPNSRFRVVSGGHFHPRLSPDVFAAELVPFLSNQAV